MGKYRVWAKYHITNGEAAKYRSAVEIFGKCNDGMTLSTTCWAANERHGRAMAQEMARNGHDPVVVTPYWLAQLERRREWGDYPKYRDC